VQDPGLEGRATAVRVTELLSGLEPMEVQEYVTKLDE
jgi:hypothetical protein